MGGVRGHLAPIGDETAKYQPLPLLPHAGEIPSLLDAHCAAELQPGRLGGHERLHRRQAFAALAAAIAQRGATTLGALACQETMLPDPATFGRLILSFHKFITLRRKMR